LRRAGGAEGGRLHRPARRSARARSARPVLVAPDSFKGTHSAAEVAAAIARGVRAGGREAVELPVADGGEGTLDVLVGALGGELRTAPASDPLGRALEASFALLGDGETAIVEAARASGLGLVAETERDAEAASSRGTGELIAAALEAGATNVLVAVGGSATTDGGEGAVAALEQAGALAAAGRGLDPGARSTAGRSAGAGGHPRLEVLCDVRTPWEAAARVFAPQKGADPAAVERLERRLDRLARQAPRDPRGVPMGGAAGGLAGGLWAWCAATLVPGAARVLDTIGFDAALDASAFGITGEGRLDRQTLQGKAAGEVATRCRQRGVGCHAVVGATALETFEQRILDLATVTEASGPAELEAAGRGLAQL